MQAIGYDDLFQSSTCPALIETEAGRRPWSAGGYRLHGSRRSSCRECGAIARWRRTGFAGQAMPASEPTPMAPCSAVQHCASDPCGGSRSAHPGDSWARCRDRSELREQRVEVRGLVADPEPALPFLLLPALPFALLTKYVAHGELVLATDWVTNQRKRGLAGTPQCRHEPALRRFPSCASSSKRGARAQRGRINKSSFRSIR